MRKQIEHGKLCGQRSSYVWHLPLHLLIGVNPSPREGVTFEASLRNISDVPMLAYNEFNTEIGKMKTPASSAYSEIYFDH